MYRVGVIGHTGRGNYGHGLDTVWNAFPNCKIVAVADGDAEGLKKATQRLGVDQGFADYRQMLDVAKPDVVSICPRWLDQRRDMVVAAAERGIHIYMEKPFCQNLSDADKIVATCEENDVKLAIAFQTRYSPKLATIRHLIEEGAIGRVLELRGRGKEDRRGGGEDLWVLGSHVMNLIHYFAGEPQWCFANVLQDGNPITQEQVSQGNEGIGPLIGDNLSAMYGLQDGVFGYFSSQRSAGPGGTGRFGLRILGSEGQIDVLTGHLPETHILQDPLWNPGRSGASWRKVSTVGIDEPETIKDEGLAGGNKLAVQDLLDAIQEDRQPEANVYEARTTVEMIAAVFASHRTKGPVQIPLQNRNNPLS